MLREVANRYSIIALIGQGGMADVYKAFDTILNRVVAVKVLRSKLSEDPMTLVRFQREAYAASKLSHPNIIDIYDVGEAEGLHYIVMEFVRGRTLKQLVMQRGALDVPEAVAIMKQLTSAVSHAHEHQIIHRDIKPQNVLIKDDGTVKITDFGIAVANDSVQLTWNNAVMGSAHYLAPEQAQGKEPDPAIDIYSLGIVFYELLTGDVPYKGTSPTEIAVQHLRSALPSVRSFNPAIPQSVENIVVRAAAKDPAERYPSARDMVQDLNTCLLPDRAQEPPLHLKTITLDLKGQNEPRPKPAGRKKKALSRVKGLAMGVLAGVVLLLLVLFAGSATGLLRIPGFLGYETMPGLVGQSQEEALQSLDAAGFDSEKAEFEYKVDDSLDQGRVIAQSVNAGRVVAQDSSIVLTVSKGPSFLIPDYTGRTLEDVKADLAAHNVNVTLDITSRGEPDTNPGIVLEQNGLVPGSRVDPEADNRMSLVISEYPSIVIPQELIGMDVDEAKRLLNREGAAVITRQVSGQGTNVVRVDPPVGSLYTQEGTDSVVTLYY